MLVSAAWIGPASLGAINELAQRRLSGSPPASLAEVLFASGDWFLYAFLTPGVFALGKRWPISRPHLLRRGLLHFAFALLFCAAWAGAGTVLRAALFAHELEGSDPTLRSEERPVGKRGPGPVAPAREHVQR